jgi:hypothetical protein
MSKAQKRNQILLEVSANGDDYLRNPVRNMNTFSITGTWGGSPSENLIILKHNQEIAGELNGEDFLALARSIRTCEYAEIKQILNESGISTETIKDTIQEMDQLKALFNLFFRMELYFVMPYDFECNKIAPRFYDEFVIDDSAKNGTPNDIYLLPMNFDTNVYRTEIETLMHINLFSSVRIKIDGIEKENYFIPFTKPSYTKDIFPNTATHKLWNNILELRNQSLLDYRRRQAQC